MDKPAPKDDLREAGFAGFELKEGDLVIF